MNSLDPVELLKLIPDQELEPFANLLGDGLTDPTSRTELADKIRNHSRSKILSALIAISGVWLTMMRDIVGFLQRCDVTMRTTGCVLFLPINGEETQLYLTTQISDLLARFDASILTPKTTSDWDEALSALHSLESWLGYIVRDSEPRRHRKISNRKVMDAAMGRPVRDLYDREVQVDARALEKVFSLWRTLEYLDFKLSEIGDNPSLPEAVKDLKDEVSQWASHFGEHIEQMSYDHEVWYEVDRAIERTDPWSESWTTEELFDSDCWQYDSEWDEWVRFIEDVLSLANLERSSGIADLMRLDLLKDRPRLFEVWCMSQILSWYLSWGCAVELESVKASNPPIWNLNYSRASNPVAHIECGGTQWWFFYQLFRTGTDRANMPDLALLSGRDPSSDVVWIADPKYSEAGGYTRKDYIEVAERYRDTFQPQHVWICEYFARRNWFKGAYYEHGDRFSILSEVQPEGEGTRLLRQELRDVHKFSANDLVLAIDCSGSFADKLPQLEQELKLLSERATAVFCFASVAKELSGATPMTLDVIQTEGRALGGSTLLEPLVSALESIHVAALSSHTLVVVTDGAFADSSDELNARLGKIFASVERASNKEAINRIIAEKHLL